MSTHNIHALVSLVKHPLYTSNNKVCIVRKMKTKIENQSDAGSMFIGFFLSIVLIISINLCMSMLIETDDTITYSYPSINVPDISIPIATPVYQYVNNSINWEGCSNPTYNQIVSFVQSDTTDLKIWTDDYQCGSFSEEVIKNAQEKGYKSGLVFLEEYVSYGAIPCHYGHAIVCFRTTDKGLYFLEPQTDNIISQLEMEEMYEQGEYYVENNYEYVQTGLGTETWEINWYPVI